MAGIFPGVITQPGIFVPAVESVKTRFKKVYDEHSHRVYSLAFWMTDNELVAEQLAAQVFLRAFTNSSYPGTEQIDRAFIAEIRELAPIAGLSLSCAGANGFRRNVKRVHLERAVMQLPALEKLIFLLHDVEGYDHVKIARLLDISDAESQIGLHQARLRVRELLNQMQSNAVR